MQKDSGRRRFPLADRVIEVIDDTLTGEVLLDEALKMMKTSEKMSVSSWIDLMSGRPSLSPELSIYSHFKAYATILRILHRRNVESHEDWIPAQTSP